MQCIYLVSACLLGACTRYDGSHNRHRDTVSFLSRHIVVPVCPEQLGGLPTPRAPAEIVGGDGGDVLDGKAAVITRDGTDLSGAFVRGARQTLLLASVCRAKAAVFKARSPSCGSGLIYDGSFQGRLTQGDGVTVALLKRCGLPVYSEESLPRPFPCDSGSRLPI